MEQSGQEVEEGEEKEEERFKEEMKVVVKRRLGLEHRYRNDNHHVLCILHFNIQIYFFCSFYYRNNISQRARSFTGDRDQCESYSRL